MSTLESQNDINNNDSNDQNDSTIGYPDELLYGGTSTLHAKSTLSKISTKTPRQNAQAKFQRKSSKGSGILQDKRGSDGVLITQLYDSSGCSNEYEDDDESSLSSSYTSDVGLYSTHYQFLDDNVDYDTDLDITEEPEAFDPSGVAAYVQECNRVGVIPASFFKRNVHGSNFAMRNHGLGPLGAKAICKPLSINTNIETLDLEGNHIEAEGAVHLHRMLRDNSYISELYLGENNIGGEGARAICSAIAESGTMTKLDLTGNKIRDNNGHIFSHLLLTNTTLDTLILRHNSLANSSAQNIRDALSDNESLRTLDLSWNHFRLQGGVLLAQAIQENYGLKKINLAMNGLAEDGAIAIGHALLHNQSLEELDISNNRINDNGAEALAKGLKGNETLKLLKLEMNHISQTGALYLIKALRNNTNSVLEELHIIPTMVDEEFDNIYQELRKERTIQVFHSGVAKASGMVFTDELKIDHELNYNNDPMTKLKKWAKDQGLRLIDIFQRFDKDKSGSVDHEEFINGVKSCDVQLTDEEIQILIEKLDKDGDGEIDYGELVEGNNENRKDMYKVMKLKLDADLD